MFGWRHFHLIINPFTTLKYFCINHGDQWVIKSPITMCDGDIFIVLVLSIFVVIIIIILQQFDDVNALRSPIFIRSSRNFF